MLSLLTLLDYLGVALFAATGALAASRKELDLMAFIFFAILTGVGGGTVRDLVLDKPVFWIANEAHVLICAGVAVVAFFCAHLIEYRYRLLLWLDAAALAAYAVYGAEKGLAATGSPVVGVLTGAMTGTLGGLLRDVIAGEPNAVTRKEVYITAAVLGATVFVALREGGAAPALSAVIGAFVAFALRGGALLRGWSMKPYRSRPGRPAPRD